MVLRNLALGLISALLTLSSFGAEIAQKCAEKRIGNDPKDSNQLIEATCWISTPENAELPCDQFVGRLARLIVQGSGSHFVPTNKLPNCGKYLQYLRIEMLRIDILTDATFRDLDLQMGVEVLILRNISNNLQIENFFLEEFVSLKNLSIENNGLRSVPEAAFEYCSILETLSLAYNTLESLPSQVFEKCTKLKYLSIAHNQLAILTSDNLIGLANLHHLNLSYNQLSSFTSEITMELSKNVTVLDLSSNKLDHPFTRSHDLLCVRNGRLQIFLANNPCRCADITATDYLRLCVKDGVTSSGVRSPTTVQLFTTSPRLLDGLNISTTNYDLLTGRSIPTAIVNILAKEIASTKTTSRTLPTEATSITTLPILPTEATSTTTLPILPTKEASTATLPILLTEAASTTRTLNLLSKKVSSSITRNSRSSTTPKLTSVTSELSAISVTQQQQQTTTSLFLSTFSLYSRSDLNNNVKVDKVVGVVCQEKLYLKLMIVFSSLSFIFILLFLIVLSKVLCKKSSSKSPHVKYDASIPLKLRYDDDCIYND